jgi:hypothetical protein
MLYCVELNNIKRLIFQRDTHDGYTFNDHHISSLGLPHGRTP